MTPQERRLNRSQITKTILGLLAVGGLLTVAAIAPNVLQVIPWLTSKKYDLRHRRYYINQVIEKLKRRGLVGWKQTNGKTYLRLTKLGQKELRKYRMGKLKINKPKKWDGKWRVIIFDIKEYRRRDRDRLRQELVALGFARLQDSVWIYPHDCEELIMLLKTSFKLSRDLLYLTVEKLENDRWLRSAFQLA